MSDDYPDALVSESDAPEAESPAPKKKRRSSTSPTVRTLAECRKRGWIAEVAERFVRFPPPGHRIDLFGCIDIIALTDNGTLGIQACPGSTHAAHRTKILEEPRANEWLARNNRLELWSWAKQGARGKRKRWTLRVETYAEMVAAQESA